MQGDSDLMKQADNLSQKKKHRFASDSEILIFFPHFKRLCSKKTQTNKPQKETPRELMQEKRYLQIQKI